MYERAGSVTHTHRPRPLFVAGLAIALLISLAPTSVASHNNQGTIKVHDNESENPPQRNVPHVDCDFWIEGFKMSDDSGWIVFYSWPPTGDKSVIESGEEQDWSADAGSVSGDFHFLAGPFTLDSGHYRVEVFTDDGHPGGSDHFAKSKTFWVECQEEGAPVLVNPPCPIILDVEARADNDVPTITLTWSAVAAADAYAVYRASGGEDFDLLDVTTATSFVDDDVDVGVTYEYYVTAIIDGVESENCAFVQATAIPFFPSLAVGALALVGSLGAFVALRRRF